MMTRTLFTVAALSVILASPAFAEADASQYGIQFQGTRTKDEVKAEAAKVTENRSTEPAGSRVASPLQSGLDPKDVRAEAAQAVRSGRISRGETGAL
jgi:Ni/Co efflux regulator RcnB